MQPVHVAAYVELLAGEALAAAAVSAAASKTTGPTGSAHKFHFYVAHPFAVSGDVAARIEHAGVSLPEPVVEDFCDTIPLARLTLGRRSREELHRYRAGDRRGRGKVARAEGEHTGAQRGNAPAVRVQRGAGANGPIGADVGDFLRRGFGSLQVREFDVAPAIDAITAPTRTEAPVFGFRSHLREESRRFILCRALSDRLVSGLPSLVPVAAPNTSNATGLSPRRPAFWPDRSRLHCPSRASRSAIQGCQQAAPRGSQHCTRVAQT